MTAEPELITLSGIEQSFPGVKALQGVDFHLRKGEVHALLGENGAGKSTLLSILAGIRQPDSGEIRMNGQKVVFRSPAESQHSGVHLIHQELQLIPMLTAVQNIFLSHELKKFRWFKDSASMRKIAADLLKPFNVDINLDVPVSHISVAQRQLVEIARAMLGNASVIAMDEPTSSLSPGECENLFRIIDEMKQQGKGVIYVSHRLNELLRVSDRITILKDGQYVTTVNTAETNTDELIRLMVGRDIKPEARRSSVTDEVVLEANNLSWKDMVKDVSFSLHKGEILGVAGLVGAGRSECMRLVAGLEKPDKGNLKLNNKPITFSSPREAIRAGIGMLPEDRKRQGIIKLMSVIQNASLPVLKKYAKPLIRESRRATDVGRFAKAVNLSPPDVRREIGKFSGGNQQKGILIKWLCAGSSILVFDEPTRGIDVGAKGEIYDLMRTLADRGVSIILVSSELPEILRMSDRVMVMRGGERTAMLDNDNLTEEEIMKYAAFSGRKG
ncbi:MAG: sugar ABC transporter ATP-binding protein [Planctomycetes bacterium]|nr:sugar ABC transporter ATP-binding protein [Planctomycetota bacterium]